MTHIADWPRLPARRHTCLVSGAIRQSCEPNLGCGTGSEELLSPLSGVGMPATNGSQWKGDLVDGLGN